VDDEDVRRDLEATVAARRELGPSHDKELVERFLERIEKEIDRRVDERVARQRPRGRMSSPLNPATIGSCVPLLLFAGIFGHAWGIAAVAAALAVVFAIALRR
jgi:hypothetical protein